jgi:hypothetical protein
MEDLEKFLKSFSSFCYTINIKNVSIINIPFHSLKKTQTGLEIYLFLSPPFPFKLPNGALNGASVFIR